MEIVKNEATELLEEIPTTPFKVWNNEGKFVAVMGNLRITNEFDTKEECINDVMHLTWNKIINIILTLTEINLNNREQ